MFLKVFFKVFLKVFNIYETRSSELSFAFFQGNSYNFLCNFLQLVETKLNGPV